MPPATRATGKALIDVDEFQPVRVNTDLTIGIPLPVRILLGTSVHGLGFTVSYQRLADGVWFPSGFGGEFSVRALFFFKQVVSTKCHHSVTTEIVQAQIQSIGDFLVAVPLSQKLISLSLPVRESLEAVVHVRDILQTRESVLESVLPPG